MTGEIIRDANFDKVNLSLESDSETDEVQLTEEIIDVLAVNVDKSRHGEPRVIKAKQEEIKEV